MKRHKSPLAEVVFVSVEIVSRGAVILQHMTLDEAAEIDDPEGTVTVRVSARLLMRIVEMAAMAHVA